MLADLAEFPLPLGAGCMQARDYIRWFDSIRLGDVAVVGGKNASLGEPYAGLCAQGVRVPNGFALTTQAYRDALTATGAWEEPGRLLDHLDKRNLAALRKCAAAARKIVYAATADTALRQAVAAPYHKLEQEYRSASVLLRTIEVVRQAEHRGEHRDRKPAA